MLLARLEPLQSLLLRLLLLARLGRLQSLLLKLLQPVLLLQLLQLLLQLLLPLRQNGAVVLDVLQVLGVVGKAGGRSSLGGECECEILG